MMSILQNQAKHLEKELKRVRLELVHANTERDTMADKLTLTEEELKLIKGQVVGDGGEEGGNGGGEIAEDNISQDELTSLRAQMDSLSIKLFQTKGELSRKDLQNAILEMQRCTSNATVESQKLKLGGLQTALDEARHELEGYRKTKSKFDEFQAKLEVLTSDLKRRDEQIEFYQEVTAASGNYKWVNDDTTGSLLPLNNSPLPSGSSLNAVRSFNDDEPVNDPLTQLENMGFDVGLAVQALESCGGNVDEAIIILTENT
ncbi:hypothetical protein TrVE_jg4764 [Triparma verrucosa]|uniref:UBA domain-containing protein n=1 Tax=Triparma verrucosa TaxID=1606542 RepID=A0A9W7CBS4_9STRA|nr:hypothetical protein TrVE_jg4764 [Triparma verrucosa]